MKSSRKPSSSSVARASYNSPERSKRRGLEKILFIPDSHIPYHDQAAYDLVVHVARKWKPEHVYILGDFVDMYSVSSHSKDPNRAGNIEYEIETAERMLDKLKGVGKNRVYCMGNHENRLERYLQEKAPQLFNVVKMHKLLKLKERGWKWIDYRKSATIGKLSVSHDFGYCGGSAVRPSPAISATNIAFGHTHRMAVEYSGNAKGESFVGAMFGHLLDKSKVDYMHINGANSAWQTGFGIGYLDSATGCVHLQAVPIVKGTCVVEGKLYKL